jgi:hypothetical protein
MLTNLDHLLHALSYVAHSHDDVGDVTYVDLEIVALDATGRELRAPYIYACRWECADAIGEEAIAHYAKTGRLPQGFGDWQ